MLNCAYTIECISMQIDGINVLSYFPESTEKDFKNAQYCKLTNHEKIDEDSRPRRALALYNLMTCNDWAKMEDNLWILIGIFPADSLQQAQQARHTRKPC